ncbi:MAG: hypothetical protein Q7S45_01890 [Candidatus Curtissbacteria bacterium]|nr:hypothetical protein [Candidatus Curtissbacteria bacterium]
MKVLNFLIKKDKGTNFFELPAKEKKRIIKEAVRGSNKLQKKLSTEYDRLAPQESF